MRMRIEDFEFEECKASTSRLYREAYTNDLK